MDHRGVWGLRDFPCLFLSLCRRLTPRPGAEGVGTVLAVERQEDQDLVGVGAQALPELEKTLVGFAGDELGNELKANTVNAILLRGKCTRKRATQLRSDVRRN
jgi:hypothetical protein